MTMARARTRASSIAICAGGTGGHLFPAEALSAELRQRGHKILLLTDERGLRYGDKFPCDEVVQISSATLSPRAPLKAVIGLARLSAGTIKSLGVLKSAKVSAMAGFGGYPTIPPMIAGAVLGIPTCLHEQNAVMGRANRFLARFASILAKSFETTKHIPERKNLHVVTTGNPVREQVIKLRNVPYEPPVVDGDFKLLIFGGSQGASVFSDIVPPALDLLPELTKKRLKVTQQCRPEDIERVKLAYETAGIEVELATFFPNLPKRMAEAHLIVARSGASCLSELTVIGRPSILIPLPHSLDNDQRENARALEHNGGAWVVDQSDFKPDQFAQMLDQFQREPNRLSAAALAAHQNGWPDAAQHLADAVEKIARV